MLLFYSWRGLFDTCWVSQPGFLSPSFVTKNSICSLRLPPRTAPPHWSPGLCLRNDFISWLALKSMEQQPLNICFYGYIFIHHMLSVIWGILHILFIYFCHREQFKRRKKKKKKSLPLNRDRCPMCWTLRFPKSIVLRREVGSVRKLASTEN